MPTNPAHLIICCCHAIYLSKPAHKVSADNATTPSLFSPLSPSKANLDEQSWLLASFQSGETPAFRAHIIAGLKLLLLDPKDSLLVFSGSRTRLETRISEAQSYLDFCVDNEFFGLLDDLGAERGKGGDGGGKESYLKEKIILEEKALDSCGNLLFSIIAFWRKTNTWPEKVTIISHAFKRDRFLSLHCKTLRLPSEKVHYLGIDPAYMLPNSKEYDSVRAESVIRGENERGFNPWKADPWGMGEVLRKKRWGRNCWSVRQEIFGSEEERGRAGLRTRRVDFEWEGRRVVEEVLDTDGDMAEKWPW